MINVSRNCFIKFFNQNIRFRKQSKSFNTKNVINNRMLIILIILYIRIQSSLSSNNIITLKVNKGNNQIINNDVIKYISEVYANDINITTIKNRINLTESTNTVKIIFNSQINNCKELFKSCSEIYEIDFTNFDSSNITHLTEAFNGCKKLKSIDLSNWDISKVTKINSLFQDCGSLTSVQ